MNIETIEQQIKAAARTIGFSHVGICAVEPAETPRFLSEWLAQNYHGQMRYMDDPRRSSPEIVLPGVRTMIVVGLNYYQPGQFGYEQEAMISKYAWAADYHKVMLPMLQAMSDELNRLLSDARTKAYVDTGPIVEKYWAEKAGIGWVGKHTNILSRQGSSWLFLGELLTTATLQPDDVATNHCGTCSLCIQACPTGAIVAPYVLDSRLCISYLTIELRDSIPRELRPLIGHRIFGCDDCQDVCPWNRFAYAGDPRFTPRADILSASLSEYLRLTPEQFRARFAGTNVLRAKYSGFLRNCLVAAGNARKPELRHDIRRHLQATDEMIREHAVWAFAQFWDDQVRHELLQKRMMETSSKVLNEIDYWLALYDRSSSR